MLDGSKFALSEPQGSPFRGHELYPLLVPSGYEQQRGRVGWMGSRKQGMRRGRRS